jgi:uncharacterized protein YjhX (UPF0386 family)
VREAQGGGVEVDRETEGRSAAVNCLVRGDGQAVEIAKEICRSLKD